MAMVWTVVVSSIVVMAIVSRAWLTWLMVRLSSCIMVVAPSYHLDVVGGELLALLLFGFYGVVAPPHGQFASHDFLAPSLLAVDALVH